MDLIENFTLEKLPGKVEKLDLFDHFFNLFSRVKKEEWQKYPMRSKVLFDGRATNSELDGTDLRAQFKHRGGYVLFTANDGYDTDETYISFLNFDFCVMDSLTLDGCFNRIGFASDFTITAADEIEFLIYEEVRKRRLKIISPPAAEFPENFQQLTARSLGGHFKKHYLKMET